MRTVLITGAYKNIGLETAKQLTDLGYYVFIGCREKQKGDEAIKQHNLEQVEAVEIDITNAASIIAARAYIERKIDALDVLINNAAISGGFPQDASTIALDTVKIVFETNLFGTIAVTVAFMDLLKKSDAPRIINVTSGLASLTKHNDPEWKDYRLKTAAYGPSKTAINAYTVALAYELKNTSFRVNAVDPGYTKTSFNGFRGTDAIETAAKRIVKYVIIGNNGPTGGYFSDHNDPKTGVSPW